MPSAAEMAVEGEEDQPPGVEARHRRADHGRRQVPIRQHLEIQPGFALEADRIADEYGKRLTRCARHVLFLRPGVFLILDGKLSVGALVAASMLAGRVLAPITGVAAMITRASQTLTAMQAIDKIMELERERPPERTFIARKIAPAFGERDQDVAKKLRASRDAQAIYSVLALPPASAA